jgi:hypothetical protein
MAGAKTLASLAKLFGFFREECVLWFALVFLFLSGEPSSCVYFFFHPGSLFFNIIGSFPDGTLKKAADY